MTTTQKELVIAYFQGGNVKGIDSAVTLKNILETIIKIGEENTKTEINQFRDGPGPQDSTR